MNFVRDVRGVGTDSFLIYYIYVGLRRRPVLPASDDTDQSSRPVRVNTALYVKGETEKSAKRKKKKFPFTCPTTGVKRGTFSSSELTRIHLMVS